jgi:hypothetical protein
MWNDFEVQVSKSLIDETTDPNNWNYTRAVAQAWPGTRGVEVAPDSPLEGDGFFRFRMRCMGGLRRLSPASAASRRGSFFATAVGGHHRRRAKAKSRNRNLLIARGPKVRIHSPPPENQAKSVDRAALSRISIFSFTR